VHVNAHYFRQHIPWPHSKTSWAHFQWQLDFYLTKHVIVDYIQDTENFHLKQIFVISSTEKATKKKAVKDV